MDIAAIQPRLNDRYESFRRVARMPDEASAPLLIHVYEEWASSKHRALIVGQETMGWGLDGKYHRSACPNCPFELLETFKEWVEAREGVEALRHGYQVFEFAKNQPPNHRSPFWRGFRELMLRIEGNQSARSMVWSNLFRVAWKDGSVLRAPQSELQAIRSAQRNLLRDEVAILQPGAVVFLTGPRYDFELMAEFAGLEFQPVDGVAELARLIHPDLPSTSFRTYHPAYLNRSHRWHVLEQTAGLISSDVRC
jgi:hypothetical protein